MTEAAAAMVTGVGQHEVVAADAELAPAMLEVLPVD